MIIVCEILRFRKTSTTESEDSLLAQWQTCNNPRVQLEDEQKEVKHKEKEESESK